MRPSPVQRVASSCGTKPVHAQHSRDRFHKRPAGAHPGRCAETPGLEPQAGGEWLIAEDRKRDRMPSHLHARMPACPHDITSHDSCAFTPDPKPGSCRQRARSDQAERLSRHGRVNCKSSARSCRCRNALPDRSRALLIMRDQGQTEAMPQDKDSTTEAMPYGRARMEGQSAAGTGGIKPPLHLVQTH